MRWRFQPRDAADATAKRRHGSRRTGTQDEPNCRAPPEPHVNHACIPELRRAAPRDHRDHCQLYFLPP